MPQTKKQTPTRADKALQQKRHPQGLFPTKETAPEKDHGEHTVLPIGPSATQKEDFLYWP
jgi:hypothetical protein